MNQAVAAAVLVAWPGTSPLARFRRRVALELAQFESGPIGPHSCLAARLAQHLRTKFGSLVDEACKLCNPPDGRVRFKQLLALGPGVAGDGSSAGEDEPGGSFLYCVALAYDVGVFLDVPALLKWHTTGCVLGPKTPPVSAGGGGFAVKSGGIFINMSGLVPRYGTPGADLASPYVSAHHHLSDEALLLAATGAAGGGGGDAATDGEVRAPLQDCAYMAFPGPAAATQLRRSLATWLAAAKGEVGEGGAEGAGGGGGGVPRYAIPWRQLAPLVAESPAAAVHPALRTPAAFKAFLLHPASAGAFAAKRFFRSPADPASGVDCVELNPAALRRAAAVGVAAAINAAWPGNQPLQQLKRTAAMVLLTRPRTPVGPYAMNAGPLGTALKARCGAAYAALRPSSGGMMAVLDEGGRCNTEAVLVYVRKDTTEGSLQLMLRTLLRAFPPDTGHDLGLGLGGDITAAPAAAAHPPATIAAASGVVPVLPTFQQPGASAVQQRAAPTSAIPIPDPWVTTAPSSSDQQDYEGGLSTWNEHAASVGASAVDVSGPAGAEASAEAQPGSVTAQSLVAFPPGIPGRDVAAATSVQTAAPAVGNEGGSSPGALPVPNVQRVTSQSELAAMLHHCYGAAQIGLAVHANGGKVAVAGIYAPPATAAIADNSAHGNANSDQDMYGNSNLMTWPATVYLLDCSMFLDKGGGGDGSSGNGAGEALSGAAASLCGLLESHYVAKVVHGCEQVTCLAGLCGATTISPLLDTRVLLRAIAAMLPPLPALPPPPPPYAVVGPLAAAAVAGLNAHVAALREALAASGLWADRPELLAALTGRHAAALREDMFAAREWSSNPTLHEGNLVASCRHLPELWEATTGEAVPWVAMAAAATASAAALNAIRLV